MFAKNIDFFAVLFIAFAMLGFAEVQSWHLPGTLDSIRIENAIQVERCPISQQLLSNLARIIHR